MESDQHLNTVALGKELESRKNINRGENGKLQSPARVERLSKDNKYASVL